MCCGVWPAHNFTWLIQRVVLLRVLPFNAIAQSGLPSSYATVIEVTKQISTSSLQLNNPNLLRLLVIKTASNCSKCGTKFITKCFTACQYD